MATNQENIISTIEALTGLSGLDYNEAIMELCLYNGVTQSDFNSMFIEFLQSALGSSKQNLSDLIAEYAETHFNGNVNAINDFTLSSSSVNNFIFQDGNNFVFQDGNNFIYN